MAATIHLQPTAELAPRVLLPGDPGRALLLAQTLMEAPKMFNHHRGLWGYTGVAADGELLTIQSTGMGGPSAAIVLHELIALGAQRAIRIGTCGALSPSLAFGDLLVVESVRYGGEVLAPDAALSAALTGEHRGPVVTSDLFYDPDIERQEAWAAGGALAVEMECAALCSVGARHAVPVAALLLVTDIILPERRRIEHDALREGEQRLGRVALAAF